MAHIAFKPSSIRTKFTYNINVYQIIIGFIIFDIYCWNSKETHGTLLFIHRVWSHTSINTGSIFTKNCMAIKKQSYAQGLNLRCLMNDNGHFGKN